MTVPPPYSASVPRSPTDSASTIGLPSTRDAVLDLLLRQGEGTAAEMAARLEVSVQVMRRHLRGLELEGLVEGSPIAEGPGRPINRWRLTRLGRGRFPDNSDHFALGLLQSMAASLPPETIRLLMRQQAIEKANLYREKIGLGSLRQRLERLVELRRDEGYVAELHAVPAAVPADPAKPATVQACQEASPAVGGQQPSAEAWVISELHCSVIRIAEQFPIVCDQELQLIRHAFPDCQVDRVHWRLQEGHSCGFRLTALPPLD